MSEYTSQSLDRHRNKLAEENAILIRQRDELAEVLQRAVNDKLGDNWKSAARIALTTLANLRGNSAPQTKGKK